MQGYVSGFYNHDDKSWEAHIARRLTFQEDTDTLRLAVDATWKIYEHHHNVQLARAAIPASTKIKIRLGADSLDGSEHSASDNYDKSDKAYLQLLTPERSVGDQNLQFSAEMKAKKHDWYKAYDSWGTNVIDSRWNVGKVTFAWTQPEITV